MNKNGKTLIIPPNLCTLLGTVCLLCAVVVLEVVLFKIFGRPTSVRWAYKGEAIVIFAFILTMRRMCFYSFQKGCIVVRFIGIPVLKYFYHECSSCTIIYGFSTSKADMLLGGEKTALFMTFHPNRPFDIEKETVKEYSKAVGKRGLLNAPQYAWITIPKNLVPRCIEIMKENYPGLRIGNELIFPSNGE